MGGYCRRRTCLVLTPVVWDVPPPPPSTLPRSCSPSWRWWRGRRGSREVRIFFVSLAEWWWLLLTILSSDGSWLSLESLYVIWIIMKSVFERSLGLFQFSSESLSNTYCSLNHSLNNFFLWFQEIWRSTTTCSPASPIVWLLWESLVPLWRPWTWQPRWDWWRIWRY